MCLCLCYVIFVNFVRMPVCSHCNRAGRYLVKFLDDYFEEAGLAGLEGNMLGMVDTIVASEVAATRR